MAYKITKYKGKTKIKDTKTNKSVEIDIDKLMNGGYKEKSKYQNGGGIDYGIPQQIQYPNYPANPLSNEVISQGAEIISGTPVWNQGLIEEETNLRKRVKPISPDMNPLGVIETTGIQEEEIDTSLINPIRKNYTPSVENIDNYQMFNPYAGVDIPSAANYLGRSISNKDTLGIVSGGLKTLSGVGRNFVSGLGQQNRYNQIMKDHMDKKKEGVVEYYAYGGKKDEEMATGEYMRGVENENIEQFNAEVEQGEYFQTNQGDISEVVGDKHSKGGEKIQMEAEDRVLSDKLKLGAKISKKLSKKYDLKLKASNTYSDVLDKLKKKTKLNKLIEEEATIIKKLDEQSKISDATTRDFNIQVLSEKIEEIKDKKHPIEEHRKEVFNELFDIQESSKKGKDKTNNFQDGGKMNNPFPKDSVKYRALEDFSKISEVRQPLPREVEEFNKIIGNDPRYNQEKDSKSIYDINFEDNLVAQYQNGGQGTKVSRSEAEKNVASGKWEDLGEGQYLEKGTNRRISTGISYKQLWESRPEIHSDFENYEDFQRQAEDYNNRISSPDKYYYAREKARGVLGDMTPNLGQKVTGISAEPIDNSLLPSYVPSTSNFTNNPSEDTYMPTSENVSGMSMYLFPDEMPLSPSSLQGTIKPEARFDRVRGLEIDVDPYLQDIQDRESSQVTSLEGLSPNVRAAALSNVRANSQRAESDIRNRIDTQNLASQEKAQYTNAQIQRQEQIQNNNYRQGYEGRIYSAQAKTDDDIRNYYNQLQKINKQRYLDIHNMNLINASNEDVYYNGQGFQRKFGSSNKDLMNNIIDNKT